MLDQNRYFQTADLHLASYLVSTGKVTLLTVEWDNKQAYFVFPDSQKCEQLRDEYYDHKAVVDPFKFANALRELKNRLYANR